MSRTLLATAEPLLPASAVSGAGDAAAVDVLTGQAALDALLASGAKFSSAVVAPGAGRASLAPDFLGGIAKALNPGGRVTVQLVAGGVVAEDVRSALLLSGFVDAAAAPAAVTAAAPSWGVGAKSSLRKPPAAATPAAAVAAAPAAATWKLDGNDDGDEELVDEEELLTEEDKRRPAPVAADDCEVGATGRKACKDCTCGRAEAEAAGVKVQLTDDMIQNPGVGSSCGNCPLGDAFRCAGCPYRGLPAFEVGKPLQLPTDFLMADA